MKTETSLQRRAPATAEKLDERPTVTPAVDVFENQDELLLVADLPGVGKNDVSVSFEKGQLTIFGRRAPSAGGNELSVEHRAFDYRRTFSVPQGIDADKVSADLHAGVLRVHLPKQESLKPRRIAIRAS